MRLIFRKVSEELEVLIRTGTAEDPFDYITMIKSLIANNRFEDTEFDSSISDSEKESINNMLSQINAIVDENISEYI